MESKITLENYKENYRLSEGPPAKMRRGEGPKVELRFLISFKTAGVIIGKGGEHINKLREEYAVKITISDSCGPERVLSLDGDMGSIMEILHSVLHRQAANSREDGIDLRLLVHQSQAGCVIGRAGYKIKELREQSGLRTLKVYQMLCPSSTDRVIQLIGEVEKALNCLQTIAELLEGAPPKGSRKNYDPLDADEALASEYGGWGSPGQALGLSMINRRNIGGAYGQIFNSDQQGTNLLTSGLYSNVSGRAGATANGTGTGSTGGGGHQHNNGTTLGLTGNQALSQALATHAHQHSHALNQQFAHAHAHQFQHTGPAGTGAANNNGTGSGAGGGLHGHGSGSAGNGGVTGGGAGNHSVGGGAAGGGGLSASAAMAVATAGLPHASAAAMLAATSGQSAGGGQGAGHGGGLAGNSTGVGAGGGPGGTTGPAGDAAAIAQQAAAAAMVAAGIMRNDVPARNMLGRTITAQVSVQNKMIGAIMGRGGCRISQVRQESGADIKISKQKSDVEDRIITITGTPEQIHNAQFLMQVCVKRYGDQTGV